MQGSSPEHGSSSHQTVSGDVISGSTQADTDTGFVDPLQELRDAVDENLIPEDIVGLLTPEVLRDADDAALSAFLSDLIGADTQPPVDGVPSPRSAAHSATAAGGPPPIAQPIAQAVACSTAPVATVVATASQRQPGSSPVVVVAPSRGGKRREVERYITADHAPEKRAKESSDCASHEGGSSSGAAGSSSAGGTGSSGAGSSGVPGSSAPPTSGKAVARERCHLCGATKRGYGRGYCSNKECRERSTLVVRYTHTHTQAAPAKPSKMAALEAGRADADDDDDDAASPGSLAAHGASSADKRAAPLPAPTAPPILQATVVPGSVVSGTPAPPELEPPPSYESLQLESPSAPKDEGAQPTLLDAYILGIGLGWLGLHWFYLGRHKWGVLYLLTFGLMGVGYAMDLLRMPLLVHRARHGWAEPDLPRDIVDLYVMCLSPLGILFGLHHWYLGRYRWALGHCCTVGFLGVGWAVDLFRLPCLVHEFNRTALGTSSSQQMLVHPAYGSCSRSSPEPQPLRPGGSPDRV